MGSQALDPKRDAAAVMVGLRRIVRMITRVGANAVEPRMMFEEDRR
jgi:hypothetical protein